MPLLAASILHAFLLTFLLGAAASVPAGDGGVNPSMFNNGTQTSAAAAAAKDTEIYICYLCTGRNPPLIRYCPIYWDECHLNCYGEASSVANAAIPAAPVPTSSLGSAASSAKANPRGGVHDNECYVMKVYRNGSFTIVTRLACAKIATCSLSCGGGDMAEGDTRALGAATAVPTVTAAIQGSLTPRVADFERCGTQASLRGAAVRAGGAR